MASVIGKKRGNIEIGTKRDLKHTAPFADNANQYHFKRSAPDSKHTKNCR